MPQGNRRGQLSLILAAIVAILAGIYYFFFNSQTAPEALGLGKLPIEYPGFQTFPTPRVFDGPGTVFRVTENQDFVHVGQLDLNVIDAGNESIPALSGSIEWNSDAALSLLGTFSAKANIADGSTYSVIIAGTTRTRVESERALDSALENFELNWDREGRVFVIRETIAAKELSVEFEEQVSFGAEATEQYVVSGTSAGVRLAQSTLKVEYDDPVNVFYLADELIRPLGAVQANYIRMKNVQTGNWVEEIRTDDE